MPHYGKKAAEAILHDYRFDNAADEQMELVKDMAEITENGVWPSKVCLESDTAQALHWKFACELDGPDALDPLEAPSLPIPFTANELAAFMLDGLGSVVTFHFGEWEHGPDEQMLNEMGPLAREPREALRGAYSAYREAERVVGKLSKILGVRTNHLANEFLQKNTEANNREDVFAQGITREEMHERRERAKASIEQLRKRSLKARKKYDAAFSAWRKAMVNQLLDPQPVGLGAETSKDTQVESATTPSVQNKVQGSSNWKLRVQIEAAELCLRLYKAGSNPTVHSIKDDMARWCQKNHVTTDNGIFPTAEYLRSHVLNSKHWQKPTRPKL